MPEEILTYLPVRELAARIQSRKLSSVGLTEQCLTRLETLGGRLNAVVTVMRVSALTEAREADPRFVRAGIAACCMAFLTA